MNSCLKKFIRFSAVLMFAAAFLISCKNSFFQSYEPGDIELILPYGQSQEQSRAASGKSYNFEVTFVHTESKAQKVLTGKSGQTIVYHDAAPGNYEIHAQAFDDAGTWEFDGEANALVKKGKNTTVDLAMKRIIRIWAQNDNMKATIESFFDDHSDSGFILDFKSFDSEEKYISELKKALSTKASNAPDIYLVEYYRTYDFVNGNYKNYAMPYSNLGINVTEELDKAKILSYIQTLGSDYTDPNNPVLKALCYQSTLGFYLYNKQVAITELGTDDPEEVENLLFKGGQSENPSEWVNLINTAMQLSFTNPSAPDYLRLTPNASYIEDVITGNGKSWFLDSASGAIDLSNRIDALKSTVNPEYYTLNHYSWGEDWYNDMTNGKVLGFFGPVWLLNYVLEGGDQNWGICPVPEQYYNGGYYTLVNNNLAAKKKSIVKDFVYWLTLDTSKDGFMYRMASREGDGTTEAVASLTVQEEVNKTVPFLRDDRMFDIYKEVAETFTIEKDSGKYQHEMISALSDIVPVLLNSNETSIIPNLKLHVRPENATRLDTNAPNINTTSLEIEPVGNNGIKFTDSNGIQIITEAESGMSIFVDQTQNNTTLNYPFTRAGKWHVFTIDNSDTYAIKAQGGMSCPVTWSEEYFGYIPDNTGVSYYISEPEINQGGPQVIFEVTVSNEFTKYINYSSAVTNKSLELSGYRYMNNNFEKFFTYNTTFPTTSDGSTSIEFKPEDDGVFDPSDVRGGDYYLSIGVVFQIEGFNNVYFKLPSFNSTQYRYPLS